MRPLTDVADHDVDITIVVYVAKSSAATCPFFLKNRAGKHPHEMARVIPQQQQWFEVFQIRRGLLDGVHHVPLRHKEILPAIVVIVEQVRAPTGEGKSRAPDARLVGHISEGPVAVIAKQHVPFVREIGDDDIGIAVIIEVAEISAHPGKGFAVLVVADAG